MRFKRALAAKNFDTAWMLALELPPLPLVDALALLLLARDADPSASSVERCASMPGSAPTPA